MRTLRIVVLSLFLPVSALMAVDQPPPEALLKETLDAVFLVLQDRNLEFEAKKTRISDLVAPMFDFNLMAKLTLGKKHWPRLNGEQQGRFTDLFVQLLKNTYMDRISLYNDETVVFQDPIQQQNKIHVPTKVISGDDSIAMLYKFYLSGNGWKIYDIEIEGVSLIATYRSQFDEVLTNGSVEELLSKLEKPAKT